MGAARTKALVARQGDTLSGRGEGFGDGRHNNYLGARRRAVHAIRACRPVSVYFLSTLKPA